ncbi:unnamed protein product [Parascedosporium putredinis]|uniref:Uncharacterized protein n=1 Tax=Parascedosporium putredinis TaxID=1442378 RepID=A0A9P1GX75_9PEZI|nr:unnamed protein product [Parascedosporium putredinis]CAI7988763.1 unnamed protein product [Parascedosporium putredinis]
MVTESPLNGMTGGVGSITLTEPGLSRPPPKREDVPSSLVSSVIGASKRTSTRSISPVTSIPSSDGGPNRLPAAARRLSKSVESRDELDPKLPALNLQVDPRCSRELREKYKSLIRHLPAKSYVDQLVSVYFKEVNWHYHVIEEDEFLRMVNSWSQIPFEVFQKPALWTSRRI